MAWICVLAANLEGVEKRSVLQNSLFQLLQLLVYKINAFLVGQKSDLHKLRRRGRTCDLTKVGLHAGWFSYSTEKNAGPVEASYSLH